MFTLDDLRNSPIGRTLIRDREAEAHAARQALLDQLETHLRDRATVAGKHDRTLQPLRDAVTAAREKTAAAELKRLEGQKVRARAVGEHDAQITRLRGQLEASVDPRVGEARRTLDARWDRARGGLSRPVKPA